MSRSSHRSSESNHALDNPSSLQQQAHSKNDKDISSSTFASSDSQTPSHAISTGTSSTDAPYQTATYGCSVWLTSILVLSAIVLGCVIHSSFNFQLDPKGCMMTYMQPSYYRILGMDATITRFAGKYNLLLYRDEYDDHLSLDRLVSSGSNLVNQIGSTEWAIDKSVKIRPSGVPALFIPGNAGSAKQVRSMAKEASKYYYKTLLGEHGGHHPGSKPIDFFTVDLNEEFSAFHGQLLQDQAYYVNEVIAYILSLYADRNDPTLPPATSVLLIGHSMGGIVARSIFVTDNYMMGSVHAILTLATPHMMPPIALDDKISMAFDKIEDFWANGFQTPHSPLANVSLVSIMGGNLDVTVNSDTGNIHHLVPQSHGFSVFTSSIPHAWVGTDHLSILWCNQIALAIGKALVDVVDAQRAEKVKPLGERMKIFRKQFLTGVETYKSLEMEHKGQTILLSQFKHDFVEMDKIWAYPPNGYDTQTITPHAFIIVLPKTFKSQDTIALLSNHLIGLNSRLDIFLCKDTAAALSSVPSSTRPQDLLCMKDMLTYIPIPASTASSTIPLFTGEYYTAREFRSSLKLLEELAECPFLVVLDRGRQYGEPGFLLAEINKEGIYREVIETTTMGLLRANLERNKFPEKPSLVSVISLPNLDSSLLAYKLKVTRVGCQGQKFAPMMRQSSWAMHEDKYSVNIADKPSIDINFHGDLPYFDKIQLGGNKGVELRFWMDSSCPESLSLSLEVDKYGSLGKVVIRYRMVVLVFTFIAVLLTLREQIQGWSRTDQFRSFGETLSQLLRSTFWKFSILLAVISVLQSLVQRTTIIVGPEVLAGLQNSLLANSKPVAAGGFVWLRNPNQLFRDALLGENDSFFWFLAPVFFQVAIGIVGFVWVILNAIVRLVACFTRHGANSGFQDKGM
ncbi:GPI inositol deacylase [Linnemannia zychae]|nr:GPI inositol deacylase [Linnemannia zychae]